MASTNRYPVRNAPSPQGSPQRARPVPANDNKPPKRAPIPANDNKPPLPGSNRLPSIPPGWSKRAWGRALARAGLRAVPIVGNALLAWEIANWLYDQMMAPSGPPMGYTPVPCTPGSGGFDGYSIFGYPCGAWATSGAIVLPGVTLWEGVSPIYEWQYDPGQAHPTQKYSVKTEWHRVAPPYAPPRKPVFLPDIIPLPGWINPIPTPFSPQPLPVPRPVRRPDYDPPPNAEHHPGPRPEFRPIPGPSAAPNPGLNPRPSRPGKGTKERKVQGTGRTRGALGWLLSNYSEANDMLDALHSALPDKLQKGNTPYEKFKDLYANPDKIDMAKAMANLINDQVSDPKMAEFFQKSQEALSQWGLQLGDLKGIGGSSGPWSGLR